MIAKMQRSGLNDNSSFLFENKKKPEDYLNEDLPEYLQFEHQENIPLLIPTMVSIASSRKNYVFSLPEDLFVKFQKKDTKWITKVLEESQKLIEKAIVWLLNYSDEIRKKKKIIKKFIVYAQ